MSTTTMKRLAALHSDTIRGFVDRVNALGIQKEDIVQILRATDGFVLLYYK